MTPKEKWQRLTNPKTVEDYGLGISLNELMEVPEAVAALNSFGILERIEELKQKESNAHDKRHADRLPTENGNEN